MRMFGFDRYGGPEVQGFFEVPNPRPGPGQVLIGLIAAGINPADVKVRRGERVGAVPVQFLMAMGREACGRVVAIGGPEDRSSGLEIGDLVFGSCAAGTGALADLVLLDGQSVTPVPADVEPAAAACIPVALATAYDALDELALQPGETLLVLGVGGVGEPALQLATSRGVRGIGVGSQVKRAVVQDAGGAYAASGEGWDDRVRALAPDGIDALLDCVGGENLDRAAALLRPSGRLRSVADPARAERLGGSGVTRRRTSRVFGEVAALVAEGTLRPRISVRVPFGRAAEAVAAVETGRLTGKAIVATTAEATVDPGPFFHGTRARLAPGELLRPGFLTNYGTGRTANHLYFSATMDAAIWGAELAAGDASPRIYRVEPLGAFADDPNLTNARFPGNATRSFRTREPVRIVAEVTGWSGHDPEVVAAMRAGVAALAEQGIEAED